MKKLLYLLSLSFLILQSCSSSDSSNANNQTLTGKLKKIHVTTAGGSPDSDVEFFYDENGRLIKETFTNLANNQITKTILLLRDTNGYIINRFESNASNSTSNTNYVITSDGIILSSVETKTNAGTSSQISASYVYTNNKISQINFSDGHQEKYTYDANGNCIKTEKYYDDLSQLDSITNVVFDTKINPFPNDSILFNYGLNNALSSIATFYDGNNTSVGSYSQLFQYSYNSNNTPKTASFTMTDTITISGQTYSGAYEFIYY